MMVMTTMMITMTMTMTTTTCGIVRGRKVIEMVVINSFKNESNYDDKKIDDSTTTQMVGLHHSNI